MKQTVSALKDSGSGDSGVGMSRRATALLGAAALAVSAALVGAAPRATAAAAWSGPGQGPAAQAGGTYAFVGVNVLPMDRERVLEDQTVVVVDGVIREVGPSSQVEVPEGATRIEGEGKWLMPGLAEMHAHVPPVPRGSDAWPDRENLEDIMFLYIANGITSIRGMLGATYQLELQEMLHSNQMLGPNFYVGAPSLNGNTAPDPEAAELLIRRHADQGYDLQKIHPGLSLETWDHMAAVAHEVGLTFAGHVPGAVGLRHALETGMSTVDHLDGYVEALASDEYMARVEAGEELGLAELVQNLDESKIPELVRLTRETDTYVVPTQYLWESLIGSPDVDAKLSQPEMKYVSQGQRDAWRRQAQGRGVPDAVARPYHEARYKMFEALADGGAKLLMGTDSPQMFNVPGFALHRELAVMEDAGLTRFQILESGTRNVAQYVAGHLEMDGDFGVVAEGNRADLVLLNANPLEKLENLKERAGVMVRGWWVSGEEIEEGLEELARKHASTTE